MQTEMFSAVDGYNPAGKPTAQDYHAFLASKTRRAEMRGLQTVPELAPHLFPFQRHCVEFGLRAGASGLFLDSGMGKTECQLEWCQKLIEATNGRALIGTPLAVAMQTKRRADRWGYDARVIRDQSQAAPGINICNYDRFDKLDTGSFDIVSFDVASILKNMIGKTTQAMIARFAKHRYKLVATATPAPNDHVELGNYSNFLGVMSAQEMLSTFFINDTSTASQEWRLKGHAVTPFWDWMASWARMAEKPSDLGDSDEGFILPPFQLFRHRAKDTKIDQEFANLFGAPSMSATTMHDVKRQTSGARAEMAGQLVERDMAEPWLLWIDTDYEADAVKRAIPWAVEIRGSQSIDEKEEKLEAFASGQVKHLIAKPAMCGFGLDWSHCSRMAFVGRSYSYETFYQAIRRCWRFGQKRDVQVHLVVAEGEDTIGRVIDRKADAHASMRKAMRDAMARSTGRAAVRMKAYEPTHEGRLPSWL